MFIMSTHLITKKISIIVVCYNDGGSVREMYRRITQVMKKISSHYEIIYVNDASPDNAYEILRDIADRDKKLIVITHTRNFGGQNAYASGLRYCTGECAITLDGDIQDPPELFGILVKKWLEGYDVVYGIREKRQGVSIIQGFFYKLFYRVFRRLSHVAMPLDASDFALVDRKVIDAMSIMSETDRFYRGMRAWVGFRQIGIPYTRLPRFHGIASGSFVSNLYWARKAITSFSQKPIDYIFYISSFLMLVSFLFTFIYVGKVFFYPDISNQFWGVVVLLFFFGSVQLFAIAVIGEYLIRIFDEVKRRPNYVIKEILNDYKKEKRQR